MKVIPLRPIATVTQVVKDTDRLIENRKRKKLPCRQIEKTKAMLVEYRDLIRKHKTLQKKYAELQEEYRFLEFFLEEEDEVNESK